MYKAVYTQTTRGKEQLLFQGQPFIYEKRIQLTNGQFKRLWRCNQWWNKKCRARVYTIENRVTPLNKYHTHQEIIHRKKRVSKKRSQSPQDSKKYTEMDYLNEIDKKDASDDEETAIYVAYD